MEKEPRTADLAEENSAELSEKQLSAVVGGVELRGKDSIADLLRDLGFTGENP